MIRGANGADELTSGGITRSGILWRTSAAGSTSLQTKDTCSAVLIKRCAVEVIYGNLGAQCTSKLETYSSRTESRPACGASSCMGVVRHLLGCGARYSILARISSGIFANRLVRVFTITHVLHPQHTPSAHHSRESLSPNLT
jgi:hypothetical protein